MRGSGSTGAPARVPQVVSTGLQVNADAVAALHAVLCRRRGVPPCSQEEVVQPGDADAVKAALAGLGGLEIAAMARAIVQSADSGAAVLVDGMRPALSWWPPVSRSVTVWCRVAMRRGVWPTQTCSCGALPQTPPPPPLLGRST